jgi:hypothetical protein
MSALRDAAQRALAWIHYHRRTYGIDEPVEELKLRDALAQQEQEPVAYSVQSPDDANRNRITPSLVTDTRMELEEYLGNNEAAKHIVPLYTAPPRREWQSLPACEDRPHAVLVDGYGYVDVRAVRAIEAKLKEKNA